MSYQAGLTAYKSGDYQKAVDELHQAVEEDDQNHKAWNALGVVLTTTGDYETADTCYENALMLAPGTPAYQRNRDKNRRKWQEEDVLEVGDSAGVRIPKNPIKQSAFKITGRPWWQYFVGIFAILFVLMLLGAAAGGGNHSSTDYNYKSSNKLQSLSPEDLKFTNLVIEETKIITPLIDENTIAVKSYDILKLKSTSKQLYDVIWVMIPQVNEIKVSPQLEPVKKLYLQALNDYYYGYSTIYDACNEYEAGNNNKFTSLLDESTNAINDANNKLKESARITSNLNLN